PRDWAPLPEQQDEREACQQNIDAAFNRLRHIPRPPLLELPARHQAVLDCEQRHKQQIDYCCFAQRNNLAAVDGLWNDEPLDETNGVEERDKEYEISCKTEDERRDFADRFLLMVFSQRCRLSGHRSPSIAQLTAPGLTADAGCQWPAKIALRRH